MGNIYSALKRGKNTTQDDDNDAKFISQKIYKVNQLYKDDVF